MNEAHIPHAVRMYWHAFAVKQLLSNAALQEIVPWGTTELSALPRELYRVACEKVAQVRDVACHRELKLGERHARIGQDLDAALWHFLKPWNRNPNMPRQSPPSRLQGE